LPGIERAGVVGQLGFDLGPRLITQVRGDPGQDRTDHPDVSRADRVLSYRCSGSWEFRLDGRTIEPAAGQHISGRSDPDPGLTQRYPPHRP
jgi:hypothetical protein